MAQEKDRQHLQDLAHKWLKGTITPSEQQEFDHWFSQLEDDPIYIPSNLANSSKAMRRAILIRVYKEAGIRQKSLINSKMGKFAAVAAMLLLIGGFAFYFFGKQKHSTIKRTVVQANKILPGGNKAVLVLADGQAIHLDSSKNTIVINNESVRYDDGSLVGKAKWKDHLNKMDLNPRSCSTIFTPKGGQYHIILPDSSAVWLNASSKLTYSNYFSVDNRELILEGEAYFEVKHGKKPFIVKTNAQEVYVLSTDFNISAYEDEEETRTTLVHGKVKVHPKNKPIEESDLLLPDQQAVLSHGNLITKSINVKQEISWKSGIFDFTGMGLPQVLHNLKRWYDLKITYQGSIPQMRFWGHISMQNNLDQVLKILESAQVKFRMGPDRQLMIINDGKGG
ncbi:FecR family protein [bacterium A37T11]|nr:FecR family protein [bacterium A37T11]